MKAKQKPATSGAAKKRYDGFSAEEKAAMRDRVQETKVGARGGAQLSPEEEVLAKIAELQPADRVLAERLHAIIKKTAPSLSPKLWYGMPAYALGGKLVCHFQSAQKFKTRYATLGFSDAAKLDEGAIFPVAYALTRLTPAEEPKVTELIRRAVG